jgi:hypothetical protein
LVASPLTEERAFRPSALLPLESSQRKTLPSLNTSLAAPRWIWLVTVSEADPKVGALAADAVRWWSRS